jgi:hypothetical protein
MKLVIKQKSPLLLLNSIFDKTIQELMALPEAWPFCRPVDRSMFEDYYAVVMNPKTLQDIQDVTSFYFICVLTERFFLIEKWYG